MKAVLAADVLQDDAFVRITGSKSESNRLLILEALYPDINIANLSNSDDTVVLKEALSGNNEDKVDVHHAGTAMRFLTAFYAASPGSQIQLTGSKRMKERPIGILVDALRSLDAHIEYLGKEGFPPLNIKGRRLLKNSVSIAADTSSQFISALLLIAPSLENGLTINLEGKITSRPYLEMTCDLLKQIGANVTFTENMIRVAPLKRIEEVTIMVESDWSSASYFYSMVALSENMSISLGSYKAESLQGDSALTSIYESFGVYTEFHPSEEKITISKKRIHTSEKIILDLASTPDIAQTIAVTCFGLGLACELGGLHTLKIKETDRLVALKTELEKLGARVEVNDRSLNLAPSQEIKPNITIETYDDHRMAMAFAPLAMKTELTISDRMVVSKSFPDFWNALRKVGIKVDFQI